jgi:outer membrane protein assembly factor BamD (BamD/ComL family)
MKRFQRLFFFGGFLIFLGFLASCQSEIDRDLKAVNELKALLPEDVNKLNMDSLPRNADSILEAFITKYPKHAESEFLCFQLVNVTGKRGETEKLKSAQWADFYLKNYPSNKARRLDMALYAAYYFEKFGVYDEALRLYEMIRDSFPDNPLSQGAAQSAKMIRSGLVTPEQQLEALLKQQGDSVKSK